MGQLDRAEFSRRAKERAAHLADQGVELVALTFVDNSGIARVKAVPVTKLASAAKWGIGASKSFDFFLADDEIVMDATHSTGPVGDLRLHPDLDRVVPLVAQPGWAWAPVWKYDQEGVPHPQDPRAVVEKAMALLADLELSALMSFELEWTVTTGDSVADGPAYGYAKLAEQAGYLRALVSTLDAQGVGVEQVHPEYAAGQFEVSMSPRDPLAAADFAVLARETIRTVSAAHGLRASFTPKFAPGGVGNGGHVHLSVWEDGENLCAGGDRRLGLTGAAESFGAGILTRLPALLAIGAPSVVSYLRLEPHHWAGVFNCWGLENREAPLRLVQGPAGNRSRAANFEVKCFDLTANPYLVVAGLLFAGLAGLDEHALLPAPVDVDPGSLSEDERLERGIERLPTSLAEAVAAFAADDRLWTGFGEELATTLVELRRRDIEKTADRSPGEICAEARWRH